MNVRKFRLFDSFSSSVMLHDKQTLEFVAKYFHKSGLGRHRSWRYSSTISWFPHELRKEVETPGHPTLVEGRIIFGWDWKQNPAESPGDQGWNNGYSEKHLDGYHADLGCSPTFHPNSPDQVVENQYVHDSCTCEQKKSPKTMQQNQDSFNKTFDEKRHVHYEYGYSFFAFKFLHLGCLFRSLRQVELYFPLFNQYSPHSKKLWLTFTEKLIAQYNDGVSGSISDMVAPNNNGPAPASTTLENAIAKAQPVSPEDDSADLQPSHQTSVVAFSPASVTIATANVTRSLGDGSAERSVNNSKLDRVVASLTFAVEASQMSKLQASEPDNLDVCSLEIAVCASSKSPLSILNIAYMADILGEKKFSSMSFWLWLARHVNENIITKLSLSIPGDLEIEELLKGNKMKGENRTLTLQKDDIEGTVQLSSIELSLPDRDTPQDDMSVESNFTTETGNDINKAGAGTVSEHPIKSEFSNKSALSFEQLKAQMTEKVIDSFIALLNISRSMSKVKFYDYNMIIVLMKTFRPLFYALLLTNEQILNFLRLLPPLSHKSFIRNIPPDTEHPGEYENQRSEKHFTDKTNAVEPCVATNKLMASTYKILNYVADLAIEELETGSLRNPERFVVEVLKPLNVFTENSFGTSSRSAAHEALSSVKLEYSAVNTERIYDCDSCNIPLNGWQAEELVDLLDIFASHKAKRPELFRRLTRIVNHDLSIGLLSPYYKTLYMRSLARLEIHHLTLFRHIANEIIAQQSYVHSCKTYGNVSIPSQSTVLVLGKGLKPEKQKSIGTSTATDEVDHRAVTVNGEKKEAEGTVVVVIDEDEDITQEIERIDLFKRWTRLMHQSMKGDMALQSEKKLVSEKTDRTPVAESINQLANDSKNSDQETLCTASFENIGELSLAVNQKPGTEFSYRRFLYKNYHPGLGTPDLYLRHAGKTAAASVLPTLTEMQYSFTDASHSHRGKADYFTNLDELSPVRPVKTTGNSQSDDKVPNVAYPPCVSDYECTIDASLNAKLVPNSLFDGITCYLPFLHKQDVANIINRPLRSHNDNPGHRTMLPGWTGYSYGNPTMELSAFMDASRNRVNTWSKLIPIDEDNQQTEEKTLQPPTDSIRRCMNYSIGQITTIMDSLLFIQFHHWAPYLLPLSKVLIDKLRKPATIDALDSEQVCNALQFVVHEHNVAAAGSNDLLIGALFNRIVGMFVCESCSPSTLSRFIKGLVKWRGYRVKKKIRTKKCDKSFYHTAYRPMNTLPLRATAPRNSQASLCVWLPHLKKSSKSAMYENIKNECFSEVSPEDWHFLVSIMSRHILLHPDRFSLSELASTFRSIAYLDFTDKEFFNSLIPYFKANVENMTCSDVANVTQALNKAHLQNRNLFWKMGLQYQKLQAKVLTFKGEGLLSTLKDNTTFPFRRIG